MSRRWQAATARHGGVCRGKHLRRCQPPHAGLRKGGAIKRVVRRSGHCNAEGPACTRLQHRAHVTVGVMMQRASSCQCNAHLRTQTAIAVPVRAPPAVLSAQHFKPDDKTSDLLQGEPEAGVNNTQACSRRHRNFVALQHTSRAVEGRTRTGAALAVSARVQETELTCEGARNGSSTPLGAQSCCDAAKARPRCSEGWRTRAKT